MSILDKLDNYYEDKKPSEVWLMVILAGALVGYLLYTILEPISSSYRKKEEARNKTLKQNISKAQSYLNSITVNGDRNYKVKKLDKEIAQKTNTLNEYRRKVTKLDGAVSKLNSVLYNKGNWSKFLNDISKRAKANDLRIYSISNDVLEQNNTNAFGKVLEVNINCQGKYGKILSFMNDLENTELVTDISNIDLEASTGEPKVDINLTVWGIKR